MIRHVVMFRFTDGLDDEQEAGLAAGLAALRAQIPAIADYRFGRDVGINQGNYEYVVVGDFATVDDYLAYRDDPIHREFIAGFVTGKISDRAAVQFEIEG